MGIVSDVIGGVLGIGEQPEDRQRKALEKQSRLADLAASIARDFNAEASPIRTRALGGLEEMLARGAPPPVDVSGLRDTANPFRSNFSILDQVQNVPPLPSAAEASSADKGSGNEVPGIGETDLGDPRERIRRLFQRPAAAGPGGARAPDPRAVLSQLRGMGGRR